MVITADRLDAMPTAGLGVVAGAGPDVFAKLNDALSAHPVVVQVPQKRFARTP
ncbi:MAG: hypothetical protein R2746_04775 [Acidimicrobiales bacterium]